jgi:hypothetical protein
VRRPLPPELIVLGDHLELATRRQLNRRHVRRQMVLNALASAAIALPVLATTLQSSHAPVAPATVVAPNRPAFGHKGDDSPPRLLRRVGHPMDDVLYDDTTLRRALR